MQLLGNKIVELFQKSSPILFIGIAMRKVNPFANLDCISVLMEKLLDIRSKEFDFFEEEVSEATVEEAVVVIETAGNIRADNDFSEKIFCKCQRL